LTIKGEVTPNSLDRIFTNDGYEIEIREENNELYLDVIEEEKNKRYISKINLPPEVTLSDLIDSFEKQFYQIIKEGESFEIVIIFNKEGKTIQESYFLEETTPTLGQQILKDENQIYSKLYQTKFLNKNDVNENMQNNKAQSCINITPSNFGLNNNNNEKI